MAFPKCLFYPVDQSCKEARKLMEMSLLKDLMDKISAVRPNLGLPEECTEQDLIMHRLRLLHPDIIVGADSVICPKHRFRLGIDFEDTSQDTRYNCRWLSGSEEHRSRGDRTVPYQLSREVEVSSGQLVVTGSRICKRCLVKAKEGYDGCTEFFFQS
jgi:hypothetical protein